MIAKFLLCLALAVPAIGSSLPYIIGGKDAEITEMPWQCSLRRSGSHSCGASIISDEWLVTAAHCISSTAGRSVRCGTSDRISGGFVRNIIFVKQHENYGSGQGSFPNDIAVMRVDRMDLTSTNARAIQMVDKDDADPAGRDCFISGWGYTRYGSPLPRILQKAEINVYTQTECKRKMGSKSINDGHVCIGDPENGRGSCNGDSGGPLVCLYSGEYKLIGATSFGRIYCPTNYYSVYSRISYFRDWIKKNAGV